MKPAPYVQSIGLALAAIIVVAKGKVEAVAAAPLSKSAVDAELLAKWSASLEQADPNQRSSTLYEISKRGPEASAAVPLVIGPLERDPQASVREAAAYALAGMGPRGKAAVPVLAKALREDPQAGIRQAAAYALAEMGPRAKAAVSALAKALREDPVPTVRGSAARALGYLASEANPAVPALIRALGDKAAYQLEEGVEESESQNRVCDAAARALGRLKASQAVPALTGLLGDGETQGSSAAMDALGEMGSEAKAAVPALIKALKTTAPSLRRHALAALGQIGPDAAEAVPAPHRTA